jgi:putative DNA primase/helicase
VQIFAERGVGKTWLARTFAIVMASGGSAMEFRAPKPVKILYLDGEMASEDIQERDRRLVECLKPSREPLLRTVAADWQDEYLRRLDTDEGQAAIEAHVEWADVLIIDNRSCLFDPSGERDPNAWEPAQRWLLSLRRQGKAVILVHHSNRMGGPRGISNAEDPLDVIIALTRPAKYETSEGARFTLSFEKNRGFAGPAVAPLTARLTPGGWVIEEPEESNKEIKRKLLSVVSSRRKVGTPVTSANDAIKEAKVGRNEALKVWKELIEDGLVREQNDGTYNASFAASASA